MKKLFLIFSVLHFFTGYSQTGGASVYAFLNLPTSARQMALGGAALTLEDDVNMPLWNPASLDESMNNQLSANYTNYLAGIALGSFVYATKTNDRLGMLHAGVTYLDYGTMIRADTQGQITGEFRAYDLSLSVGYAYQFKNSPLKIGANVKLINSLIDTYSSLGIATDVSVFYKPSRRPVRVSLVFRNIGLQLKSFDGVREKIPFQIALGFSSQLQHVPLKWYATLDNLQQWDLSVSNPSNAKTDIEGNVTREKISFAHNAIRHAVFGAELFPDKKLCFRIGYNYRRAKELSLTNRRTSAGISYGFGLRLKNLQLNYALTKFHPETNANTFSLLVNLD